MSGVLVSIFDEVIETLSLHKLFHEFSILAIELIQVVIEVKYVNAWQFIIN
jgi:hypothetical protein